MRTIVLVAVLLATYVAADVYMHAPRGSNDRLNEANTNRNNGNRLFDSQNNAKGGYCYGPAMSYYAGSLLMVSWTNQHGCGPNPKLECNVVLQYMCGKKNDGPMTQIRDGTTTDTIPDDANGPVAVDANGDLQFGMHESYEFYQDCKTRERNMGLWISDREDEGGLTPGRASSIFTRQNNNGNRNGYECAEERDYYPYWAPTAWRDIAILTSNEDYCEFYQSASQNVAPRFVCKDKETGATTAPNNENSCNVDGGVWTRVEPWNIPKPECVRSQWSRDNHLGSGLDGFENSYNWTLPTEEQEECIKEDNCNCVLRLRYNITTVDLGVDANRPDAGFIDWTKNAENSPVKDDAIKMQDGAGHMLALDTTQFGRTFQDRSYVFHIKPRPDGVSLVARIFNLNVRGKRGNIVQAYPATEYDFVPEAIEARVGDYIHFQWTGCDTNPAGNAGEGRDGTDRSNMVQLDQLGASHPATDEWIEANTPLFETKELRLRMAMLDQVDCKTYEQLKIDNNNNENNIETDPLNCMKLNAAPPYFDGGLVRMNLTGQFYYMSSRNNNFTNRGQKGAILVKPLLPIWAIVVVIIGAVLFVLSALVAGMMLYAKSHPHSGVASAFSRL